MRREAASSWPMAVESAELRQQLAHLKPLLVEIAIEAEHLHAQMEHLHDELTANRAERDGIEINRGRHAA